MSLGGRRFLLGLSIVVAAVSAQAQHYGPGVTDTEIRIGNIMPYSGPASAYGTIGKAMAAYFAMLNDAGGIGGRKVEFVSLDDAYSPPKAVEQTRKLVEQEEVLLMLAPLGTPSNSAIHRYMNSKKVPHLFLATGASKWDDPRHFPWTMGWHPNYRDEGAIYARHILETKPDARIGIIYQNDDYGRDYLGGFKEALGEMATRMIVAEVSYEVTDPTIDSQIVALKSSGADTFFNITTPKFAAQAIRKAAEIGWNPVHYLNNVSNSVGSTLEPAGLENAKGILSGFYHMDPNDPQWQDHPAFQQWDAWMNKYYPSGDRASTFNVYGYLVAQTLEKVLEQAGDELTRENVMKQAASLDLELPMLLPGVRVKTSADDYAPIEAMRLAVFDGTTWVLQGDVIER